MEKDLFESNENSSVQDEFIDDPESSNNERF